MNNKGFTLVELLAVIVILALLAIVAGVSVSSIMKKATSNTNDIVVKNLEDAALTYGLDKLNIPNSCAIDFELGSIYSLGPNTPASCITKIKVKKLKDEGYFKDDKKICDENKEISIYKYVHYVSGKAYYDLRASIPTNTCG